MTDNDKSAAQRFMEEHEMTLRDNALLVQERDSFKDIATKAQNLNEMQASEIENLRFLLRQSEARTRVWVGYTMKLTGQLDAIGVVIADSQKMAKEAAREIAISEEEKNDVIQGTDDPLKELVQRIGAIQGLPDNKLQ